MVDSVAEVTGVVGTGREAWDGLMKDEYGPLWEDHVNKSAKCLSATGLGKVRGRMGGRRQLHAVIDSYPQSAGVAHFENATLTDPSSATGFQPQIITRSLYVRLRWTGEVEDMARTGSKATFAGPRATELRLARNQYAVNKCRMAILGPQQVLGKIEGSVSGAGTQTITATMQARNDRTSAAAAFYNYGTHYFRKGMQVDWGTTVTSNSEGASGVDGSSPKWTVDSATGDQLVLTTTAAGGGGIEPGTDQYIWPWASRREGAVSATTAHDSYYAGYNGLNNLMLDSSIYGYVYGVQRSSTYPTLDGNRQTGGGSGRNFNDLLLILSIDNIVEEGSGEHPDTLYLNSAIRREVIQHLGMGNAKAYTGDAGGTADQARRFAPVQTTSGYGKLALVAGDKNMTYDTDRDCPPGMIYILRKGTMGYLSNRALSSIDKAPERYVADKDAHEVIMAERGNFFCTSPWTNGTLEDVNFSVSALTAA